MPKRRVYVFTLVLKMGLNTTEEINEVFQKFWLMVIITNKASLTQLTRNRWKLD